ncbi:MAG: hypothetical protein FWD74_06490, partial [Actinomycetia bacterium]|nr:hypothetical protein [Actinomycetes bacterium]
MIHTFPIHGPIHLGCRTGFGSVTVHADEQVAEARVELTQLDARSDSVARTEVRLRDDNTLIVRAPGPRGSLFDIPVFGGKFSQRDAMDVRIDVPPGTLMHLAAWGGEVTVAGRVGALDIASGAATVVVDEVDGDFRLRFGSGSAQVARVRGSASVKSGAGDARLGEVGGTTTMVCGSGSLEVAVARGPVRMRAGTGSATIGVA